MDKRDYHVLWVEKYRPLKVEDCILSKSLKATFLGIVKDGVVPNLLLCGAAGSGKTTVAKAICNELALDFLFINASKNNSITDVRTTMTSYASALAFGGKRKVIILDEADNLSTEAQLALRASIEEFAKNCSFILTCNFKDKLLSPIHSRCVVKDFRIPKEEKPSIIEAIYKRIMQILDSENVKYDKKVLANIVVKFYPDFRRTLNELQGFVKINGEVNEGVLIGGDISIDVLYKALKNKSFNQLREWVVANVDNDPAKIYRKIYDGLKDHLQQPSIPQAIILLHDYQYKSAFAADLEINLLAFLIEMMVNCDFI